MWLKPLFAHTSKNAKSGLRKWLEVLPVRIEDPGGILHVGPRVRFERQDMRKLIRMGAHSRRTQELYDVVWHDGILGHYDATTDTVSVRVARYEHKQGLFTVLLVCVTTRTLRKTSKKDCSLLHAPGYSGQQHSLRLAQ
jgi:hypothetical protein